MASVSCVSLVLVLAAMASVASAQLSPTFYENTCPLALRVIRTGGMPAVVQEARMGASLVRLHFHDCFVDGCDGSVLLADTGSFVGEQGAAPNAGSIRGMNVIDNVKKQLEAICPQTVSCADILAVAARDSVFALGGPSWAVPLGRRDSTTASKTNAEIDLPLPTSDLQTLTNKFINKDLSAADMAALSGAHTIGQSQCKNFRDRIYNDTNIDPVFATSLKAICPQATGSGNSRLAPLDRMTPNMFDNAYYRNLLSHRGLLHSDQVLFNGGDTDRTIRNFASNPAAFRSAFATAMVKMGNIAPKTGTEGQIRLICSKVNA
ncbi:unnamed protein product [Alopecurus aequalis]